MPLSAKTTINGFSLNRIHPFSYLLRCSLLFSVAISWSTLSLAQVLTPAAKPGPLWEPEEATIPLLYIVLESETEMGIEESNPPWQTRLEAGWTFQSIEIESTASPGEAATAVAAIIREVEAEQGDFRYQVIQASGSLAPVALEMVENPELAETIHGALVLNADFDPDTTSRRPLRPLFLH